MKKLKGELQDGTLTRKKENARSYIAQLYVWAFFAIIGIALFVGVYSGFKVNGYKDLLIAVFDITNTDWATSAIPKEVTAWMHNNI